MNTDYMEQLKTNNPNGISKEQFYKLCHISKRTAKWLLESGLVPCKKRGQQTHRYRIAVDDAIEYLAMRESVPERYSYSSNRKKPNNIPYQADKLPSDFELLLYEQYQREVLLLPDILTVQDVRLVTGYSTKTITKWCRKRIIHCFLVKCRFLIPKECLLSFMMSARFRTISVKSDRHHKMIQALTKPKNGKKNTFKVANKS